jgi:hypothetical protein
VNIDRKPKLEFLEPGFDVAPRYFINAQTLRSISQEKTRQGQPFEIPSFGNLPRKFTSDGFQVPVEPLEVFVKWLWTECEMGVVVGTGTRGLRFLQQNELIRAL